MFFIGLFSAELTGSCSSVYTSPVNLLILSSLKNILWLLGKDFALHLPLKTRFWEKICTAQVPMQDPKTIF